MPDEATSRLFEPCGIWLGCDSPHVRSAIPFHVPTGVDLDQQSRDSAEAVHLSVKPQSFGHLSAKAEVQHAIL